MKVCLILLLALISCGENDRFSQVGTITSSANNEAFASASFYKCDYERERFAAILRSGTKDSIFEVWGVDRSDIEQLPRVDLRQLDSGKIIRSAEEHLKRKYPNIQLVLYEFRIEPIVDHNVHDPRNRFAEVTFRYDGKGAYQVVPVLLDGRVILSNKE